MQLTKRVGPSYRQRLPDQLSRALVVAATAMREDVDHRLPLLLRRDIYDALGGRRTKRRYRSRTWLAILAAQRVYPVAASALPGHVDLVDRWLAIATDLVQGHMEPDSPSVTEYVLPGITVLLRPYYEDPTFASRLNENASGAVRAANLAAAEALGDEGLDLLSHYPVRTPDGSELPGEYMTDEQLIWTGAADAAACAARAEAWKAGEDRWDSRRQKGFWEWWLHEAVPKAFALGSTRTSRPYHCLV